MLCIHPLTLIGFSMRRPLNSLTSTSWEKQLVPVIIYCTVWSSSLAHKQMWEFGLQVYISGKSNQTKASLWPLTKAHQRCYGNAHAYNYSVPPSTARLHAPTHPPGVNNSTEFDGIPLSLTDTSRYVMCFFPIPSMTDITSIPTTIEIDVVSCIWVLNHCCSD